MPKGIPLFGDRSAHNMSYADYHASDIENSSFTYHNDPANLPARIYAETIGDSSSLIFTITHNLGSMDVIVQLWALDISSFILGPIEATSDANSIEVIDDNNIEITFNIYPDIDAYRVVVMG